MGRLPRLFMDAPLSDVEAVPIASDQYHYLANVLRLSAGQPVQVFNGRDGEWLALLSQDSRRPTVAPQRLLRRQIPETGPWVAFATVKRAALELIVQKATELGASRLIPVITDHAVTDRVNQGRLKRTAIEAAEQCGRLGVPEIAEVVPLAECLAAWPPARPLIVACEQGAVRPVADALRDVGGVDCGLLTGPEGGFSVAELDAFAKLTIVTSVGLGPRVLRAETAAISLLACYQAWAGDWRISPNPTF